MINVGILNIALQVKEKRIMKKFMSIVLAATMSMAMLAGCGSSTTTSATAETSASTTSESVVAETTVGSTTESAVEETSTETSGNLLASIKESGKLVVGTASGYPPYEFVDITSANQDVIGIDIALAQAIADELGVELVVQDMNFSALLTSIPAHKIDLAIAGIAPTDERKESMDFSDVYLEAEQSIIILKSDADKYKTLEDFNGQNITAQKSTTQEALAIELMPEANLTALDKVPDCILELINGKAAGVIVESVVGQQYIISNDELTFSEATFDRQKDTAVALEKGNEDLLEIVNKVIQENKDNGNFDKWIQEYSEIAAQNAQ